MLKLEFGSSILSQLPEFCVKLYHGMETTLGHVPLAELVQSCLTILHALSLLAFSQAKHFEVVGNHLSEEQVPGSGVKVTHDDDDGSLCWSKCSPG